MRLLYQFTVILLVTCISTYGSGFGWGFYDWVAESGDVSVETNGNVINITASSDKTILNFHTFNVQANQTVNFFLPSSTSSILNRVTGGQASTILGQIFSNGIVMLLNPAGINIANTAKVNAAGFMASTMQMTNQNYLSNQWVLENPGTTGKLSNDGKITTIPGGFVVLAGSHVENRGQIYAPDGTVHLAVGDKIRLNWGESMAVEVVIDEPLMHAIDEVQTAILNSGQIEAHTIALQAKLSQKLYDQVVNNTGVIRTTTATRIGTEIKVVGYSETGDGVINNSGTLDVSGNNIVFEGGTLTLASDVIINSGALKANGPNQGGNIFLNAQKELIVNGNNPIEAIGKTGGNIAFSSEGYTALHTALDAHGDNQGGQIQLSSETLDMSDDILVDSPYGRGGLVNIRAEKGISASAGQLVNASGELAGQIKIEGNQVLTSGTYLANSSKGKGGQIDFGGSISMLSVVAEANGTTGGGLIRVGGEYQGGKNLVAGADQVKNDQRTMVSQGTKLEAKSTGVFGDGGQVIVWSDETTHFYGNISTTPGTASGNGGFVEVSGKDLHMTSGNILTGLNGRSGEILLDPKNLYIQDAPINGITFVKLALSSLSTDPLTSAYSFGTSLALNNAGNILAIGAIDDSSNGGQGRGGVYLFNLDTTDLSQAPVYQNKITDGLAGVTLTDYDNFGMGVSLNNTGSILAVGVSGDDTGGTDRGAVYLFNLNTADLTQTPTYQYKLADGSPGVSLADNDLFGSSLAFNDIGDILAVGAWGDDTGGSNWGATYLFNLNPADLTQAPAYKYKLAHGSPGLTFTTTQFFGTSVALNSTGDILAVGAPRDNTGGSSRGATYLFNLNLADLTQAPVYKYKLANGSPGLALNNNDSFGTSVALNGTGDILAVGAYLDDTGGNARGCVRLFNLNTADLTQAPTYRYKIADGTNGLALDDDTFFGRAVALNGTGDILAVGGYGDSFGGFGRGASYLFNLNTADLTQVPTYQYKLSYSSSLTLNNNDYFGISIGLNGSGNILAVGAYNDQTGGFGRGSVYLFNLDLDNLTQTPSYQYKLADGSPGVALNDGDYFGTSLALNDAGNILAVGAYADDTGGNDRGATYLFNLNPADLTQAPTYQYKLTDGSPGLTLNNGDSFGSSLALNDAGNILVVGAYADDTGGNERGAAYLFNLNPADLTQAPTYQYKLAHGSPGGVTINDGDGFGWSLALNGTGDILAVGTFADDTGGNDRGAAYLFNLNPADLTQAPIYQYKLADGSPGVVLNDGDYFGSSLALNAIGNILAVGAFVDDTGGDGRGSVYLFNLNPSNLTQAPTYQYKLVDGSSGITLNDGDGFGWSLALNHTGNILTIGAYADDTGGSDRGAAYIFNLGHYLYTTDSDQDTQVSPSIIASLLATGNNLTLQANNDIFLEDDLIVNNAWGNGGNLTLAAGRSILLNANLTSDNGDITLIANDLLANSVVDAQRDVGVGVITQAAGTTINAGTGAVMMSLRNGTGKTNSTAGDINLEQITASSFNLFSVGSILDTNGVANNLTATANSFLTAGGTIGTFVDPLEVNVNGGALTVAADGSNAGYSVVINGTVNPNNALTRSGTFPGLVCFNGDCWNPLSVLGADNLVSNLEGQREVINNNKTESRNQLITFKEQDFLDDLTAGNAEIEPLPAPVNRKFIKAAKTLEVFNKNKFTLR